MKIALVTHRYPPDAIAGVERYTQMLAGELAGRGDAISIITRRPGVDAGEPKMRREMLEGGIQVFRITGGEGNRENFGAHQDRLERLFEVALVETSPDVVHVNHLLDHSPRLMEIALQLRSAVVLTLHDFYFACPRIILQQPGGAQCSGPNAGAECIRTCFAGCSSRQAEALRLRAFYFRRLLGVPQYVLCPSAYVADYFRRWGGRPERIFTVPNGIAMSGALSGGPLGQSESVAISEVNRQCRTLRLAFLGSVVRHKGVHVILQALKIAQLGKVELEVNGPAEQHYVQELKRQARRVPGVTLGLRGPYSPEDLPERLAGIDCVVAPSQWAETFLLVAREAMVCGVPVVVSRLGALPEAVVEGVNGFSFDHDQPEQLAAIFRRMVMEKDLLPRLREGAKTTAAFSISDHATMVRGFYRRALIDLAKNPTMPTDDAAELDYLYTALAEPGAVAIQ